MKTWMAVISSKEDGNKTYEERTVDLECIQVKADGKAEAYEKLGLDRNVVDLEDLVCLDDMKQPVKNTVDFFDLVLGQFQMAIDEIYALRSDFEEEEFGSGDNIDLKSINDSLKSITDDFSMENLIANNRKLREKSVAVASLVNRAWEKFKNDGSI